MEALQTQSGSPVPPLHVAIIMDGNGRWAKSRGLPRTAGHRRGAEAVREAVKAAADLGVSYLTLFGFSSENWKRPQGEVSDLMGLLRIYLRSEIKELHASGVRLCVVGERQQFAPDIVRLIEDAEKKTAANTKFTLVLALNYGGRQELVRAARRFAEDVAAGRCDPAELDEQAFAGKLFTAGIPDPDLLIRTSGEKRISNFLLWQSAYAEMVFLDVLWPDFSRTDLEAAMQEYQRRERRYGTVG
ncbi:isoprenyl transferase [Telmatospirillum siberiense]|uniref:Isoprenyl transferase n=1 Tax=Telmatospirillum siberiense TaxID=382514 RepID=A0A2N3PZW3_9PROT|nr:isoprenyl transferase [Telmatospirillum siberiense]PKU25936.1 di-trans,poly-cis-decaprenylcistransferase [Telmatospirillum siberiense]